MGNPPHHRASTRPQMWTHLRTRCRRPRGRPVDNHSDRRITCGELPRDTVDGIWTTRRQPRRSTTHAMELHSCKWMAVDCPVPLPHPRTQDQTTPEQGEGRLSPSSTPLMKVMVAGFLQNIVTQRGDNRDFPPAIDHRAQTRLGDVVSTMTVTCGCIALDRASSSLHDTRRTHP